MLRNNVEARAFTLDEHGGKIRVIKTRGARLVRSALCISNLTLRAPFALRFHAADSSSGALPRFPFPMTCVVCMRARCVHAIVYAMPVAAPVDPALCFSTSSFHRYFLCSVTPSSRRGGAERVIEFLKANFSRAADGLVRKRPRCVEATNRFFMYLPTFQPT